MAEANDIPPDVRTLIARHVDSVVHLELLLLLYRDCDRGWTAADAAREMRIDPTWTVAQLDQLVAAGLLRRDDADAGTYRCVTARAVVETMGRLARAYGDRRVSTVALIYAKPSDSLRTFADAFRFRKGPNDG